MPEFPPLGMPDIREWAGDRSFELGRRYVRNGSVLRPRRQDHSRTLKARVRGTAPRPYRVEVSLNDHGIAAGECSCPVGAGGHCKHAAALLIAWLEQPESFAEVEDLETLLARLENDQLRALLTRIARRHPDVEDQIERELIVLSVPATDAPVDVAALRRQVVAIMESAGYGAHGAHGGYGYDRYDRYNRYDDEWSDDGDEEAGVDLADEMQPILLRAQAYLDRGDVANAALVYDTVARTLLDTYVLDEDWGYSLAGSVGDVVRECVVGLENCLTTTSDPAPRERILRALFDLYRNDSMGMECAADAPEIILLHATPEERQLVSGLVRAALPQGKDVSSLYALRRYGPFLLDLEADTLDDDSYVRLCRQTGQLPRAVARLLERRRVDAAVAEVADAPDEELLPLADLLREGGYTDRAEHIVRKRERRGRDARMVLWLRDRAREAGDLDEALALTEKLFWRAPSAELYAELRALAQPLGTWEKLRTGVLAHLTSDGHHALVTALHVDEGQVDEALAALARVKAPSVIGGGWEWGSGAYDGFTLRVRVARAAEATRPAEAIGLYLKEVDALIATQGRERYATAAGYLARVRDLYARQGQQAEWQRLIASLREQHKRLRALKDELSKAGL
jgi:SWIM zinc finger